MTSTTGGWRLPDAPLRGRVVAAQVLAVVGVAALALAARRVLPLGAWYPFRATAVFAVVAATAVGFVRGRHPFARFGPANQLTMVRAGLVALVVALVGEPVGRSVAASAAAAAFLIAALDGVDGWLARRSAMASEFGARFDMEVDALLGLTLATLVWRHEKAGGWILLAGLLRYLFVIAGWLLPWLRRPLPPSRRRQAICVVQIVGLAFVLAPDVLPPLSPILSAVVLLALCYSFAVDVAWLARAPGVRPSGLALACVALFLLNASLTFHNVWPTPVVTWRGELSVELAVCLVAMALVPRSSAPSSAAIAWLSAVWVAFVLARYAEVTAPALYGREVNLYWDSRHVSAVVQMLFRVASFWVIALVVAGVVLVPLAIFAMIRWAFARVARAMRQPRARDAIGIAGGLAVALFGLQQVEGLPAGPWFAAPVAQTYWRQARLFTGELTNRNARKLGPGPSFDADLSRIQGADVLLFFLESYGATSYDRPEFAGPLAPSRAQLESDIRATGRDVVSAYVESPTFGGNSWLAHVSLLSGIEVRDEDTNMQLMAQKRDSLATAFGRRGYRTVAIMPGLHQSWPEGRFYGFNEIYDEARLDYRGPPFGWWTVPDQFTIARLDALELARKPRPPAFVFFPTVGTHTPFSPTAPYQPDWARVLTDDPYEQADLKPVWLEYTDWLDLGPSYVHALSYTYASIGGYLRLRAGRDFVLVLIGDHQPPAVVSGEGARWDVPVHIVSGRKLVLDALLAHGFRRGLTPNGPALMKMHALTPVLLGAFGASPTD